MSAFTEEEILEAQQQWGDGIVNIGKALTEGGDHRKLAEQHLDTLYAFGHSPVLFKPTKAAEMQFRNDRDGALSYFIAQIEGYPEDHGFALQPWTAVRFENTGFILKKDIALVMGNYYFTDVEDVETKVEFTFGYIRDAEGKLRIAVHHSSLPYSG